MLNFYHYIQRTPVSSFMHLNAIPLHPQDFGEVMYVLLDPQVQCSDISPQQHQCIIKAFLCQGEQVALAYS